MTTKNGGAAPRKGPPAKPISDAERALLRSFAQGSRTVLTRDVFLRSQGPPVVEVFLGNLGVTVLMRRIDLLDLARRGADYYPFRSAIYGMIREGGLSQAQLAVDSLQDTLDLAARVALDTIVVSPPEYVNAVAEDDAAYEPMVDSWLGEIEEAVAAGDKAKADALRLAPPTRPTTHASPVLASLGAADLKPLFVEPGDEPDPDQVVLRYALPDDDGVIAEGDGEGGIPPADLVTILRAAHQYGPGALGRRFRGDELEAPALGALRDLAGGRS